MYSFSLNLVYIEYIRSTQTEYTNYKREKKIMHITVSWKIEQNNLELKNKTNKQKTTQSNCEKSTVLPIVSFL